MTVLLGSHFPGARIHRGPERSLNTTKIGANSMDWHNERQGEVDSEHIMPYTANCPDGTNPICLQNGLDLISI